MRRRPARFARAAWLVLATSLVATGCEFDGAYDLPLPGSPVDADEAYEVTAEFRDILNVVPRSPVMVDDVTVGEVTDVERSGWHAKITLRVREDVVLPDNAIADIRQVSLLGEKYVALEAPVDTPATGQLGDGDTIPLEATGRNPEVEEVLGALSFLLSGGGVGQLGTITRELNNAMTGRTERLRNLLGSLEGVIGTLDAQKADIIRALESMNNLTKTLNAERRTITDALDATGPAIEVLANQHDELIDMLSALDELGVVGTRVIGASKEDILDSLRHLRPILRNLNEAGDSLAPGLNLLLSFPFPQEASEVVLGDYANTSIRADLNLENVLPPGSVPDPDLPELPDPDLPELPDVPDLRLVQKCLASGDITSKPCRKVLADSDQLRKLTKECQKRKNRDNPVCRALSAGGGGDLPGVPDLPGIGGLTRLNAALSSGEPSPSPSPDGDGLYGGDPA